MGREIGWVWMGSRVGMKDLVNLSMLLESLETHEDTFTERERERESKQAKGKFVNDKFQHKL